MVLDYFYIKMTLKNPNVHRERKKAYKCKQINIAKQHKGTQMKSGYYNVKKPYKL